MCIVTLELYGKHACYGHAHTRDYKCLYNFILAILLTFIILTQQGISVSLEQLETFLKEFPQTPMHHLLEMFENIVKLDITTIISCMEN